MTRRRREKLSDTAREEPREEPPALSRPAASRREEWLTVAAIVVAAVATYARGVAGGLVVSWDDGRFLVDYPAVHRVSWASLTSIFGGPQFEAYHPLHLLSYWLDVPWVGANGPVLHAVSLTLWCVALALVYFALRALALSTRGAGVATLLYGVHPVQVEAVTWATGRKEILCVAFVALALLAHVRARRWNDAAAWLARAAWMAALLSKTTSLPLPLVLLAFDVLVRGVPWRRALGMQLPALLAAPVVAYVVLYLWGANAMVRGAGPDAGPVALGSAALVLVTLTHQVLTVIAPVNVSPIYPVHDVPALDSPMAWLGLALVAAGLVAAWRARSAPMGFALLAFLVLLVPVSNVVPLYFRWQDRYLSLPLLPLAYGAGALCDALAARARSKARPRAPYAAALVVVAALCARTISYEGAWQSDAALWRYAVSAQPRAFYAWLNLGGVRRERGDYDGAIRAYQRAIDCAPSLRMGPSALFLAVALRDERRLGLRPSRAMQLAAAYHGALNDAPRLLALGDELRDAGYRDATRLAVGRARDLRPVGASAPPRGP
jgi:hypothetical protein